MADYIYLLESRLTPAQQRALATIRTVAREQEYTVFLTGGAVRDMTGGGSIRDLDLTVQGDALTLKGALVEAGATVYGEHAAAKRLFLSFAGGVRVEVASAMVVSFPTPGKPEYAPAGMTDDLRSRDFTANAMAISLNEGSYGLLMDPLNGVADIENRELRLVSNYGFIEDPSRLIRAARLRARLGWHLEERTQQRYDTAKEENYIAALSPWNRGYELEEVFHEEDPVRVLRALEAEGLLSSLTTTLSSAKAASGALAEVAERQGQLQTHGIFSQSAALNFPLLTAKLSANEVSALKADFVQSGFVQEIESLDGRLREFTVQVGAKETAKPSAVWRLLHAAEPNLVLALLFSSKAGAVQSRLKTFLVDSPTARQRIPYVLMTEMRITPDMPGYDELVERLFFELMDGNLSTSEEMKAFLEPYSPPAPPPPVNLRRARAKKEARPSRAKGKKAAGESETQPTVAAEEEAVGVAAGLMEPGTLTGPDRGTEPSPREPLEGKVAPEPGQLTGPVESMGKPAKPEVGPTPAKKVKATPAPVSKPSAVPKPVVSAEPIKPPVQGEPVRGKVSNSEAGGGSRAAKGVSTTPLPEAGKSLAKHPAGKSVTQKPPVAPAKQGSLKAAPVAAKGKTTPTVKAVPTKPAAPVKTQSTTKLAGKSTASVRPAVKASAKVTPVPAKSSSAVKKVVTPVKTVASKVAPKAPAKTGSKTPAKKSARR